MVTSQRPPVSPVPNASTGLGGIPGIDKAAPDFLGELKSEVAGEATPLLSWITGHIKTIIAVFAVLVLTIIGYGAWQWQAERSQRSAQLDLGRILVTSDPAARISALEAFLNKAPENLKPGVNLEIAVSAVAANQLDKAAEAYRQVRLTAPDSASSMMAALNEASLLLQLNRPAEAVSALDTLEGKVPDFMKNSLREHKAFALEQAGRTAEALPLYEAMLNSGSYAGTDFIRFKINELKSKLGK